VVRFRFLLVASLALSGITATIVLHAQLTDEEKRAQFLKARGATSAAPDESPTPSPKPKGSPHKRKAVSPSPKPKPKKTEEATPSATPKETPSPSARTKSAKKRLAEKEGTPKKKKKQSATPRPEKSPSPRKSASPRPSETPLARPVPAPRAIAVPSPSAPPAPGSTSTSGAPVEEPEQLTIEKYGYEKPRGFWARLFGGGGSRSRTGVGYRYLTRSVRDQIDRAPVARARWQYIVVHNSGTRQGNAAAFDYYHRHVRRMQNGLAYHFVIGNGTSTGNGQIEVGDRWRRQINGGHVHSDYLNNIALGICLVGDFNRDQPTRAQLDCCEELIRYLRQRCGKVGDHYPIVKPHREMNPPRWPTDCPGDAFPYSWFRRFQE
jgi:N-acetylmuramoyl-L-alanine amidase